MYRILIFGNSGSGKSTLANKLAIILQYSNSRSRYYRLGTKPNCHTQALNEYSKATHIAIDYTQAKLLFKEYLARLGNVMSALTVEMRQEINAAKHLLSVS